MKIAVWVAAPVVLLAASPWLYQVGEQMAIEVGKDVCERSVRERIQNRTHEQVQNLLLDAARREVNELRARLKRYEEDER